jgi:nucleoside-diphosphate-sugar epimerase
LNRLIVGCGYVGRRVSQRWRDVHDTVYAITRSNETAKELAVQGIQPIVWNWFDKPDVMEASSRDLLQTIELESILISVSHAKVDGTSPEETHVRGLVNLFSCLAPSQFNAVCYLSTTGVYAQQENGEWVDEEGRTVLESETRELASPGSIAAANAEAWLQTNLIDSTRLTILRPSGIYGPGRIPQLQSLYRGEPLATDPNSFLNLVHVDDLAAVAVFVSSNRLQYSIYNVSDGNPALRRDYYRFICKQIDAPEPRFLDNSQSLPSLDRSLPIKRRGLGNKRISNIRLQSELPFELRFPSYREGLTPLLQKSDSA